MERARLAGGALVMSSPSISTLPELTVSSPAMMRSSVDLPQPEGPTKTTNSPSAILRSTAWITAMPPKDFRMPRSVSSAMANSSRSFHPCVGDAGGDEALQEHEHQRHRCQRHHGHRQQI